MSPAIAIREWRNQIVVPRDHPAPARVRDAIDASTAHVATALADGVAAYLGGKAGQLILIRNLTFDCDVDMRCDRSELARALAYRCAIALTNAIESGTGEVVRFASRAALIARYAEDVASGDDAGQWYYRTFEGLRALPATAAIRTALVDDPPTGRDALALIARDAWPALARTLDSADAARILDALASGVAGDASAALLLWLDALRTAPTAAAPGPPTLVALMLYAQLLHEGHAGDRADAAVARVLAATHALLHERDNAGLEALQRGDAGGVHRCDPALAEALAAPLAGPQAPALRALVRAARTAIDSARGDAARPHDVESTLPAPFAGYALLLGEIDDLLVERIVATFAPLGSLPVRGLAVLAALGFAAGGERAQLLWADAAWRELLGVDPALQWRDYAMALRRAGPRAARNALAALDDAIAPHLRGERLVTAVRAGRLSLVVHADASTGLWLRVRTRARHTVHGRPSRATHGFRARLAAARRTRADWLALDTGAFGSALPPCWRLFFATLAQVALRRLAQRIPGMATASIAYLRTNLLCGDGQSTRLAPDHWRWRVRRPPLHVLLALCGIARSEQAWRGPPQRRSIAWEWV